jgi:hypothetical protein
MLVLLRLELLLQICKSINRQAVIKFRQNAIEAGGEILRTEIDKRNDSDCI